MSVAGAGVGTRLSQRINKQMKLTHRENNLSN